MKIIVPSSLAEKKLVTPALAMLILPDHLTPRLFGPGLAAVLRTFSGVGVLVINEPSPPTPTVPTAVALLVNRSVPPVMLMFPPGATSRELIVVVLPSDLLIVGTISVLPEIVPPIVLSAAIVSVLPFRLSTPPPLRVTVAESGIC